MRMRGLGRGCGDFRRVGMHHLHVTDRADRRAVASAHAGRAHHAHIWAQLFRQFGKQPLGAKQRAGQRIADPHGNRRRRRLAFLHHIEMGVEGRHLVDLGERKLHFLRQGGKVRGREMTVMVLNQMQMLDEEIAPARPIGQQREHFLQSFRIDLTALRRARRPAPPGAPALAG